MPEKGEQTEAQQRPAAQQSPKRGRPGCLRRTWRWFAALVLLPGVILLVQELTLRIVGYGYPTSFFVPSSLQPEEVLVSNPKYGLRFFPPALARTPLEFRVKKRKPANTFRIFVLGGSAAMGDPAPSLGMARILACMLQERFPDIQFEVVNAAMTAINSHVVYPIAKDCARQAPDLFIIYMGNNEVVGPFGPGTVFGGMAEHLWWIRAGLAAKRTRIGQFADSLFRAVPGQDDLPDEWKAMAFFLDKKVGADDPRLETVYAHFERNLTDVCRAARQAGAGVLLCTVGVDLKDTPPFASEHRPELSEAERVEWEEAYATGNEAQSRMEFGEALDFYERALAIDDTFAGLVYRMAQCQLELRQFEMALHGFRRARDLDCLRFRADSSLNKVIRDVAERLSGDGARLVDVAQRFEEDSPNGLPGDELFLEHVHMTFRGNYLVACALFEQVTSALGEKAVPLSQEECRDRLAYSLWDQYRGAENILGRLKNPPFTNQIGHAERIRRWEARVAMLGKALENEGPGTSIAAYERALARTPDDWYLNKKFARLLSEQGDHEAAAEHWRTTIALMPEHADAYVGLGKALRQAGHPIEAIASFDEALRLDPGNEQAQTLAQQAREAVKDLPAKR